VPAGSEAAAAQAVEPLRRAAAAGRLAHALLIVGPPRGQGLAAAERILQMVFCQTPAGACGECRGCRLVQRHVHPDVRWLEPTSVSRQITIGDAANPEGDPGIRFGLLQPLNRSAIEGGWKAGVLLAADRLTPAAANALLKTLEEPPPQTLLVLVTDEPQRLPATIRSRCQEIVVRRGVESAPEPWRSRWLDLLAAADDAGGPLGGLAAAARLSALWDEIETAAPESEEGPEPADADVVRARRRAAFLEIRRLLIQEWLGWERDVLAVSLGAPTEMLRNADRLDALRRAAAVRPPAAVFDRIRRIGRMERRLALNFPHASALAAALRGGADETGPRTSGD